MTRWRRYRDRQRNGRAVLMVEVDLVALEEAMIAAGMLGEEARDDRAAVAAALARVVALWSAPATRDNTRF